MSVKKIIATGAVSLLLSALSTPSIAGIVNLPAGKITHIGVQDGENEVQLKLDSTGSQVIYLQKHFNQDFDAVLSFLLACWASDKTVQLRVNDDNAPSIIAVHSPSYF